MQKPPLARRLLLFLGALIDPGRVPVGYHLDQEQPRGKHGAVEQLDGVDDGQFCCAT
jgi:hypothetical protein